VSYPTVDLVPVADVTTPGAPWSFAGSDPKTTFWEGTNVINTSENYAETITMAFSVTLKNLGAFAAASNLQLFLRKTSDNSLLNAGGDTGADTDSIGSFIWSVSEDRPAEQMLARIYEGSTETAASIIIDSVLNVGFTELGQEAAVLDSASVTAIRDGIPKVGETHRYTQVDSGATTTDVSIGAAT